MWLPDPDYGLPANEQVLLNENTGNHIATTGQARAINDFGIIVGQNLQQQEGVSRAVVWLADSGGLPFPTQSIPATVIAFGVTNYDPTETSPNPPGCLPNYVVGCTGDIVVDGNGFLYTIETTEIVVLEALGGAENLPINVFDVSTVPPSAAELCIVGGFVGEVLPDCSENELGDAVFWFAEPEEPEAPAGIGVFADELEQPDSFSPPGLPDLELNGEARGVNDGVPPLIVGWGDDYEPGNACEDRALLWEGVDDEDPIILGANPEVPVLQETKAEAINNGSPLQVVGQNTTALSAVIWEESSPGVWDYEDLNNLIDTTNCGYELSYAWDINDNGWIVASGVEHIDVFDFVERSFLLVPLGPCPEDVNQDGVVDRDDENIIILNGGTCPIGRICWADVNGDCQVDATDQALVRAILSGSPCGGGEAATSGPCLCPAEMVMLFGDDICACVEWMAALEAAGGL